MTTYRVNPESFKAFQKRMLLLYSLTIGTSIIGAIFVFPIRDRSGIIAIIITIVLVLIIAALAISRTLKRMREVWSTYALTIGDDFILKTQAHHSDIQISSDEIKTIRESFTGDLAVKTHDWKKFIIIPRSLDKREEVENLLIRWKPIVITSKKTFFLVLSLIVPVFIGLILFLRYYLSLHLFSNHLPNIIPIPIKVGPSGTSVGGTKIQHRIKSINSSS